MEKFFGHVSGKKFFLQIGSNYSLIPIDGVHSYACLGKPVILYFVNIFDEVLALKINSGFVNRIISVASIDGLDLTIEVFTRSAGANPRLVSSEVFDYDFLDVL